MNPTLLYIGHNGPLGLRFCELYRGQYTIVGVSRKQGHHAALNFATDVQELDFASMFQSLADTGTPVKHIMWAPNVGRLSKLENITDHSLTETYNVGVFALIRLFRYLAKTPGSVESVTIISSISGMKAHPEQTVYGSMKATQNALARHGALELAPIRVNTVAPGNFKRMGDITHLCNVIESYMKNGKATGKVEAVDR